MFWHRVGIHPDVRILIPVSLEMYFEVSFGCEAISTDVTFEGPLPSMRAQVDLEGTVIPKGFATIFTLVLV